MGYDASCWSCKAFRLFENRVPVPIHSRPQRPRSFWPVAGIESSGQTQFSEHAQSISFVLSINQICQIWWEVGESRTSGVGQSQSSRFLPQASRIVGSGDENGPNSESSPSIKTRSLHTIFASTNLTANSNEVGNTVQGLTKKLLLIKAFEETSCKNLSKKFKLVWICGTSHRDQSLVLATRF